MAKKLSKQAILNAFEEKHGHKYRYPAFPESFNIYTKIKIICPIHGEFCQSIKKHKAGHGCPQCAHIKTACAHRVSRAEWIRRFESVHGKKYDYSALPATITRQDVKVKIFCPKHNLRFLTTPVRHWAEQCGCPICGHEKQAKSLTRHLITRQEFIQHAREIHKYRYEYPELPPSFSLDDSIIVFCNVCRQAFFRIAKDHLNSEDCRCHSKQNMGAHP